MSTHEFNASEIARKPLAENITHKDLREAILGKEEKPKTLRRLNRYMNVFDIEDEDD